jgi:hypothetical protein
LLLDQLIAVERGSCSFLGFSDDGETRRLTITAADDHHGASDHLVPTNRS